VGAAAGCGTSAGSEGAGTPAGSGDDGGGPSSADGGGASSADGAAGAGDGAGTGDAPLQPGADAGTLTRTVDMRPYRVVVPTSYSAAKPMPMLLLLHGYSETSTSIDAYFATRALAESKGFLLVLPDGNTDSSGLQYWNADDACCDLYGKHPDDVGYLHDVITDVKSAFNVDAKRVYAAGHSNGAFMSHRLACDHADEIAGIVALSGMVWLDATKCAPSASVAVLQVHGTLDSLVYYNGGTTADAAYPSAPATVATWAAKNGCDATLTDTKRPLDLDTALPGSETKVETHTCTTGAAELWTIQGANHFPTFGADWAPTFYAFLQAHPKP
jgi:polyhydroxybutyrate depolymerase